jgi:hypothetical protein
MNAQPLPRFLISARSATAASLILMLALVLRILGARGELWLDELWSFRLIDEMQKRHDIFFGMVADNNHYLNTLYLYLVGADAPILLQRALSIVIGTITVAVAALAVRPTKAGPLCAMLLFATSYPMVNYGSEARGYAGLILMMLLAILLTERAAAGSKTHRFRLGLVNVIGVMFQPIMMGAVGASMGWTAWLNRPTGTVNARTLLGTALVTLRTFSWTVRLLIPFAALIAFSVLHAGGYRIAGPIPFSMELYLAGYGGIFHSLLGLPDLFQTWPKPNWVGLIIAAFVTAAACKASGDRNRIAFYLIFVIGLPLTMAVVHMPNVVYPRYYLASGIVFLLMLADLFAWGWARGGVWRSVAVVLLAAIIVGNSNGIVHLICDGRDQSAAMMRMIGGSGPVTVTSNQDLRNRPVVEFMAKHLDLPVTYVLSDDICTAQPEWLLSSWFQEEPETLDTGPLGCNTVFKKQASFPQWGLSGLPWTVYRIVK